MSAGQGGKLRLWAFEGISAFPVHGWQHEPVPGAIPGTPTPTTQGEAVSAGKHQGAGLGARDGGQSLFLPTDLLHDLGRISPPL